MKFAASFKVGLALSTATPIPANSIMLKSLRPSPNAITFSFVKPSFLHNESKDTPLEIPLSLISIKNGLDIATSYSSPNSSASLSFTTSASSGCLSIITLAAPSLISSFIFSLITNSALTKLDSIRAYSLSRFVRTFPP